MRLVFTDSAWTDYLWFQDRDRKLLKRINSLIKDIIRSPTLKELHRTFRAFAVSRCRDPSNHNREITTTRQRDKSHASLFAFLADSLDTAHCNAAHNTNSTAARSDSCIAGPQLRSDQTGRGAPGVPWYTTGKELVNEFSLVYM